MKGTYGNSRYGYHDFEAHVHNSIAMADGNAPNIAGVWEIPTESPKGEHAWRLIIQQKGAQASAAILRVDGDTGALVGAFHDGKFVLNHFDGARASVMEIVPKSDGSLDVALRGFHNPTKTFSAIRLQDAKAKGLPEPSDPDDFTRVKNPDQPFQFSFPHLAGNLVSNTIPVSAARSFWSTSPAVGARIATTRLLTSKNCTAATIRRVWKLSHSTSKSRNSAKIPLACRLSSRSTALNTPICWPVNLPNCRQSCRKPKI